MSAFGDLLKQCRAENKMTVSEQAPPIRGSLIYTVYKNGVEIDHVEDHNLVVNGGRTRLAELISGKETRFITKIGFGTGGNSPQLTDTTLDNLRTIEITSSAVSGQSVTFNWFLDENHCNGMNISEFGLFTSDDIMVTHQQRGRVIGKEVDITIQGQYILNF